MVAPGSVSGDADGLQAEHERHAELHRTKPSLRKSTSVPSSNSDDKHQDERKDNDHGSKK